MSLFDQYFLFYSLIEIKPHHVIFISYAVHSEGNEIMTLVFIYPCLSKLLNYHKMGLLLGWQYNFVPLSDYFVIHGMSCK